MRRPPISPDWWFKGHCSPLLTKGKGTVIFNDNAANAIPFATNGGVNFVPLANKNLKFYGDNYLGNKGTVFLCLTPTDWNGGSVAAHNIFILTPVISGGVDYFSAGADSWLQLYTGGSGDLSIELNGAETLLSGAIDNINFAENILHTIAVSWNSALTAVWLDGLLLASATTTIPNGTAITNPILALGHDCLWPDGVVKNVMAWKRAIHDPMFHLNMAHRFGAGR